MLLAQPGTHSWLIVRETDPDLLVACRAGEDLAPTPGTFGVMVGRIVGRPLEGRPGSVVMSMLKPERQPGDSTVQHVQPPPVRARRARKVRDTVAYSGVVLINRPRREMACVASAATPMATIARSAVGSGRTIDRN